MSDYFSKKNTGGQHGSRGYTHQDCVAIFFIFKYLDQGLTYATFETVDDLTIEFEEEHRLKVQIKIEQLTVSRIKKYLEVYHSNEERQVIVGSGMNGEANSLLKHKKSAENSRVLENNSIHRKFEEMCNKKEIDVEKLLRTELRTFPEEYRIQLAKSEIEKWSRKEKIYIDVDRLFDSIYTKVSLRRSDRGNLSRDEVCEIISQCRSNKITSTLGMNTYDFSKRKILKLLEKEMSLENKFFDDLHLLKYEIESDNLKSAYNRSVDLYQYNVNYLTIHLWLLNVLKKADKVLEFKEEVKMDNRSGKIEISKALFNKMKYDLVIEELNAVPNVDMDYEVQLYLALSYNAEGQVEEAKNKFLKCINISPNETDPYLELAKLSSFWDREKSLEYINKALKIDDRNAIVYLEKGKICRYYSEFQEAINCFEKYLDLKNLNYLNVSEADYEKEFVLREIAFSSYSADLPESTIHFNKWISCMINIPKLLEVIEKNGFLLIDIGYDYTNFILIVKNAENDYFDLSINGQLLFSVGRRGKSTIGVGCVISESNLIFASMGEDCNQSEIENNAKVPALFMLYEDYDSYDEFKQQLVKEKGVVFNKEYTKYEEYYIDADKIAVQMFKHSDRVNITVSICGLTLNFWIPKLKVGGYHEFQKKLRNGSMFDEAALVLKYEKRECRFVFKNDCIEEILV